MKYLLMDTANVDPAPGGGTPDPKAGITAEEANNLRETITKLTKANATAIEQATKVSNEMEALRKTGLKAKEDYKALYEGAEAEKAAILAERDKLKNSIFTTARVSKVKEEALKLGLRQEATSDIESFDLDSVEVNISDSGMIEVKGAKEFADILKKTKPYFFKTPNDPAFNAGGGGQGGGQQTGTITSQDVAKAFQLRRSSAEAMQKYNGLVKQFDEQTRKKA